MSDIAIRVENPCPERSRRMGKQYPLTLLRAGRIGARQERGKTLRESLVGHSLARVYTATQTETRG